MSAVSLQSLFVFQGEDFYFRKKKIEPRIVPALAKNLSLKDLSSLSQVNRHFRKAIQKLSVDYLRELTQQDCIRKHPTPWLTRFAKDHPNDSCLGVVYRIYAVYFRSIEKSVYLNERLELPSSVVGIYHPIKGREEKKIGEGEEPLRKMDTLRLHPDDKKSSSLSVKRTTVTLRKKGEPLSKDKKPIQVHIQKQKSPQDLTGRSLLSRRIQLEDFQELYQGERIERFKKYENLLQSAVWENRNSLGGAEIPVQLSEMSIDFATEQALKLISPSKILEIAVLTNYWEIILFLVKCKGILDEETVAKAEETGDIQWTRVYRLAKVQYLKDQIWELTMEGSSGQSSSSTAQSNSRS